MSDRKGAKGREPDEVRKGGPSWGEIVGERNYERGNLREEAGESQFDSIPTLHLGQQEERGEEEWGHGLSWKGEGG